LVLTVSDRIQRSAANEVSAMAPAWGRTLTRLQMRLRHGTKSNGLNFIRGVLTESQNQSSNFLTQEKG
jgi:hypothetical protein